MAFSIMGSGIQDDDTSRGNYGLTGFGMKLITEKVKRGAVYAMPEYIRREVRV